MDHVGPKYFLIKKDILNKINEEIYKPDETIPPEPELMKLYGVSRITVRKAVDELVSECVLYKVQGKGTYVKGNTRTTGLSFVMSCTEEIRQQGFTPSRKLLSINIEKCPKKLAHELEIEENSDILHTERIYYADLEPVIYCENFIVKDYLPGIEDFDFNKLSLYEIIQNHYNINIVDSVRYIEAVAANGNVAEYLDVPEGYPTLRFNGNTRASFGNKVAVFEVFNANYITGKIKFRIDQKSIK